jgi:hypothetical protein
MSKDTFVEIDEFYAHPENLPSDIKDFVPDRSIAGYVEKFVRIAYDEDGMEGIRIAMKTQNITMARALEILRDAGIEVSKEG